MGFYDFYSTNRLDPWWYNTPGLDIIAYIHISVGVYLVFAYLEVFSFYLTGYDNQGKFPVTYTFPKRFVSYPSERIATMRSSNAASQRFRVSP